MQIVICMQTWVLSSHPVRGVRGSGSRERASPCVDSPLSRQRSDGYRANYIKRKNMSLMWKLWEQAL